MISITIWFIFRLIILCDINNIRYICNLQNWIVWYLTLINYNKVLIMVIKFI